jgi:hypothetical protein
LPTSCVVPKPSNEPENEAEKPPARHQAREELETFYAQYLTAEEIETAKENFKELSYFNAVPKIEDVLPIETIARCHIAHGKRVEALEAKIAANEPL